eukprot:scaffold108767_cov48-Phaeocystis_antarctica.AAC.2
MAPAWEDPPEADEEALLGMIYARLISSEERIMPKRIDETSEVCSPAAPTPASRHNGDLQPNPDPDSGPNPHPNPHPS